MSGAKKFFRANKPFDREAIEAALRRAGFERRGARAWFRLRDQARFDTGSLREFAREHPEHVEDVQKKLLKAIADGHGICEIRAESKGNGVYHVTVESRPRTPEDNK